ncbi:MAG: bifunctional glutamate N-acetyltransferase/amino-acid acetyltransferase ArgJ [Treponema sp.]|nr:bifunctional glutamate N-acetyltransferase/amino-acid acetyltransferase ArgJ [Treponema sp.]
MQNNISFIEGGVCAPQGFTANGMLCHIKASRTKNDTALIFSEVPCNAAGVFTQNRVKAESVKLTQKHLANGKAQALIAISGNANCCTGAQGAENAYRMAKCTAEELGIKPEDVIVYSTGVIGAQLDVTKVENNIAELKKGLSKDGNKEARIAIMTTDTQYKECAVEFEIDGKKCRMGTMCKGSGMIHINMGTMLSLITTDCAITSAMLSKALHESILGTYNCVSVDGDTSTNDSLTVLANGLAGNTVIAAEGEDYDIFLAAMNQLNVVMARKIAADGEGATRLIECNVKGASSVEAARGLAKEIICSSLVKAAMFGSDANFGRFLCAMGYSGIEFDPEKTSIWFTSNKNSKRYFDDYENFSVHGENSVKVYENGVPLDFDEDKAKEIMSEEAVEILVQCGDGKAEGRAWGCDLTYDYVKINGDYRT